MIEYEEISLMVDDCMKRESKLSAWEQNFIQSLSERLHSGTISSRQLSILEDIWERIT